MLNKFKWIALVLLLLAVGCFDIRPMATPTPAPPTPDVSATVQAALAAMRTPVAPAPLTTPSPARETVVVTVPVRETVVVPITQVVTVLVPVTATPSAPVTVQQRKFEVSALGWNDTGIVISAGDWLQISVVGGRWTVYTGSAPFTDGNGWEGRRDLCTSITDHDTGGLVGQIGNNPPFWVGNDTALRPSPYAGNLKLSINDCPPFGGNEGSLTVHIAVMKP
jgi:hypothetical protein